MHSAALSFSRTVCVGTTLRRVYHVALDGSRWRVYDRVYERMVGWHAHAPPAPGAAHRVFVPKQGVKRVYEFKGPPPREFTPTVLETQLRAAQDMVEEDVDSASRNPWYAKSKGDIVGAAVATA